jgi:hypothetical protein
MNDALMLGDAFLMAIVIMLLVYIVVFAKWENAVKGSRQRYIYTTVRIIASYTMMLMTFITGMVYLMQVGVPIIFGLLGMFAIVFISELTAQSQDDDNWFSGQWNKIKNGVKSFITSVQFRPATTTAA